MFTPPPLFTPPPPPRDDVFTPSPTRGDDFFGDESNGDNELPNPLGLPFDFDLAGYLPLGGNYNDDYQNLEGYVVDPDGIDWADVDYVVVKITEPNGSTYYTTLVGNFDDYDEFYAALAAWWVDGSL